MITIIIITIIINNLKDLNISNISPYSGMHCRHIPKQFNDKVDAASISTIFYISLNSTMRCTHLPRFRSVKENATLIELCSSTNFFGIVTITSFVNLCFSASSTSASLCCSANCYHTTIRVFSELRLLPAFRT